MTNPLPNTAFRKRFLRWDRPALPAFVKSLVDDYRAPDRSLDLANLIVVVPGQRTRRRLLELLALAAIDNTLLLTPPEVVTEGTLPELLYVPEMPFASEMVQDLTWARALRALPDGERRRIVPQPPAATETVRWLALGRVLRRLHVELAADGLAFVNVRKHAEKLAGAAEAARWQALVNAQERYHDLLRPLKLWDRQSARLVAIANSRAGKKKEVSTDREIILLGTVDLNASLRQMLDLVADRVTAYIAAPPDQAQRFDGHGCLKLEQWVNAEIPLRAAQLQQVDGPTEQAEAVADWLARVATQHTSNDVVIGVPDESLVPHLQRQLDQLKIKSRWVDGIKLGQSAPYRLLEAATRFASDRRYEELAALVRHPDLAGYLTQEAKPRSSLPAQLDAFYNAHLPSRVPAGAKLPTHQDWPTLQLALDKLDNWLGQCRQECPLRQWSTIFRDMLLAIYGDTLLRLEVPDDDAVHRVLSAMARQAEALTALPPALDSANLSAADAFVVAFVPLADEAIPPPADPDALEILGWLELPLDDAGALLVTSFNEGFIPQSAGADPFLPDRLRKELGLLHNERRYARDAYATMLLCRTRPELHILFARRDTNGDPVRPSRLLFACTDDEMVRRAALYFAEPTEAAAPRKLLLAGTTVPDRSAFAVPKAHKKIEPFKRIAVTQFKHYLACRYRYYLRFVEYLKVVDDAARDLDGGAFGTLLHHVLSKFGNDTGIRDSQRPNDIRGFVNDRFSDLRSELMAGSPCRPAVEVQFEQLRQRLDAFAEQQAAAVQEGWRIVYAEPHEGAPLARQCPELDEHIELIGKIDRIDYHEERKILRIVDYKTADTAATPEKTHRDNGDWVDLQLPLYLHLWPEALARHHPETIELGYFNLPKQRAETGFTLADWDATLLADADETARAVIAGIRAGDWSMAEKPPKFSEDFAAICQDRGRRVPEVSADEEGEDE